MITKVTSEIMSLHEKNNKIYIILTAIFILAFFLRVYKVDKIPLSMQWDEVATAYDANSILTTGKDQFGNVLPLVMRSLDDYKPPLYTYLAAVSIKFWGWNDFAIRFPAVLLGSFAVITCWGMVVQLFGKQKLALLSALILAISPWHMHFSRLALESNQTVFFTTLGVWLYLLSRKNGWFLPISIFSLMLNLYVYHSARVFIPALMIILFITFPHFIRLKKQLLLSFTIFILLLFPLASQAFQPAGLMRFQGASIFTPDQTLDTYKLEQEYGEWRRNDALQQDRLGLLSHSKSVMYGLIITKNYLSHFDPNFWILSQDSLRHHIKQGGIIYFLELPLLIVGLFFLLINGKKSALWLSLAWFLLAPIPASITRDVPHSMRMAIAMPIFQLFIASGIYYLARLITNKKLLLIGCFFILLYSINVYYFQHNYFSHYAVDSAIEWVDGRKEAALYAESIKNNYEKIIVSTRLGFPHIFFLYHLRYNPQKYLSEGGTVSGGWGEQRNSFDKYEFREFKTEDEVNNDYLLIGVPEEFPKEAQPLKTIYYPNNEPAVKIFSSKQFPSH